MRRIILFTLIAIILLNPLGAYASFVVRDDFDSEALPGEYGIKTSSGNAELRKVPDGAKELNALVITDDSSGEGVTLYREFENINGTAALEIKFRIGSVMTNMNIMVGQGSTLLSEINIGVAGEVTVSDGYEQIRFSETVAKINNWITLRFVYYPSKNRLDVRCNQEILKNLKPCPDYSGKGIDSFILKTGTGTPVISIDYLYIEKGSELDAGIRPIEPIFIEPPAPHPVEGIINVCYNGEYKFFDYQPVIRNSRVLIPFRRIFSMLGMEISYDENIRTATGRNADFEISITAGSNKATVNGTESILDVTPEIIENSFYVPVRFISQTVGKSVDWDDETKTVIIND